MSDLRRALPNNPTSAVRDISAPRAPTKLAKIIEALAGDEGASIAELVAITGWKIRTIRGALAGTLKYRHRLAITSVKTNGGRVYRAAPQKPQEIS